MLEARNLTFRNGGRDLVSDVSLVFEPGMLHLIAGPNGAGKSTLIKLLARSIKPHQGTILYNGSDANSLSDDEISKHRAVLSQAVEVAFPLEVRELVMMGRYPHFRGRPRQIDVCIVDKMLDLFGVTEFAARNYQTLSGGERQRVNFARVLAQLWRDNEEHSPTRYLLLDEPLTFLDIRHQIDFMKLIRTFASNADVVTVGVVHDLNLAARFADHVVLLSDGKIVVNGAPADVLTDRWINTVFGVKTGHAFDDEHRPYLVFD